MLLVSNLGRFNWLDKAGAECPRVAGQLVNGQKRGLCLGVPEV